VSIFAPDAGADFACARRAEFLVLALFAVWPAPRVGASASGDLYDLLYPDHVDVCALSQIRPLEAPAGGSAGHAVMFLSGVCRVPDSPIPLLETCKGGAGTGVSVNKVFKNINWVAVADRQFFFHGILSEGQRLTRERLEATIRKADDLDVFRGIEVHEEYLPADSDTSSLEEFIARDLLGTDFALNYGRTIFCAKLPVTPPMLERITEYLNGLNLKYASGEADYQWSGYADNCTHTIRNSLASAGVWRPKSVNTLKLLQIFHLAVPANEFVALAALVNDGPLENPRKIHGNDLARDTLERYGWLPTRHGGLIRTIEVHPDNDLYDTHFKLFVLEGLLLRNKTRKARRMIAESRYTDLEANLRYFEGRYEVILGKRPDDWRKASAGDDFHETRRLYYEYIESQLEDVQAKLVQLSGLRGGHSEVR
jgi:hypothetical protein